MSENFRLRINWLPTSRDTSVHVARTAEAAGFEGLGVCDSPRYDELYSTMETCLASTTRLVVGSNVTNPVTRDRSVHVSGYRSLLAHGTERVYLGVGTGDSAVRTSGGRPATWSTVEDLLKRLDAVYGADATLNVAASGPRGATVAGRARCGLVAGVGRSRVALERLLDAAAAPGGGEPREVWASLRVAVGADDEETSALRQRMIARAVSAARFNLGTDFTGRDVPERFHGVLADRFSRYDFAWHGRSGVNPNAGLFADHPDIEHWLVERFAIVGTGPEVVDQLRSLHAAGFAGVFLSILFEDPVTEIERLAEALAGSGMLRIPPAVS